MGKYLYGARGTPGTGSSIGGAHTIREVGKWNLASNELN